MKQETYIGELDEVLEKRKLKNPKYSARALARDIGIDPGDLTNILNGKKRITTKIAYKIGLHLGLKDDELLSYIKPTLSDELRSKYEIFISNNDYISILE